MPKNEPLELPKKESRPYSYKGRKYKVFPQTAESKPEAMEDNMVGGNTEESGVMAAGHDGGINLQKAISWKPYVNDSHYEHVVKRSILSTNVLLGDDGKQGTYNTARTTELVIPVNIYEYWFGSNQDTALAMAPAVLTGPFKIKSLYVQFSNLMIYEDTITVAASQEVVTSVNNNNIYCMIQSNHSNSVLPVYKLLDSPESPTCAIDDDNVLPPTVNHFVRGEIANKTTLESMNIVDNLEFWRPGDPPKAYQIHCDHNVYVEAVAPVAATVHQLPLNGLAAQTASSHVTYSHYMDNYSARMTKPELDTISMIKFTLPNILESGGKPKKFRMSFMMEQIAVIEKRNNWLQKISAANYHFGQHVKLKAVGITDTPGLNPPVTFSDTQGFLPYTLFTSTVAP